MKKHLLYFLLITFGFAWLSAALIPILDYGYGSFASICIVACLVMPAPALAAWIVQTRILKLPFAELGVTWKNANKPQLSLLPIWLFIFLLANFGWIYLLGNLTGMDAFGTVDFSYDGFILKLEEITEGKSDLSEIQFPATWIIFTLIVFAGVLAGATFNLPFTLGEEIGWRGFLFKQLEHFNWIKRSLITGTIWGIWHAPLILLGHNYPEHPYWGIPMMILFCVALSFPFDIIRRNTQSVLGPAAFHGMINSTASAAMLFIQNGDVLLGSIAGLSGVMSSFTLLGILVFVKKYIPHF